MAVPLRNIVRACSTYEVGLDDSGRSVRSSEVSGWKNEFRGKRVLSKKQSSSEGWVHKAHSSFPIQAQASIITPRHLRWWEKSSIPNMTEIKSADELVHSLLNAGDKLVVVDFYAPGCGGCRAVHPKICQIAESNPSILFLKVNYDEHKAMCNSLHIHVLPFFRFYRGAQGRVCSFSCTNATPLLLMSSQLSISSQIKKFKEALAKHGSERCSLGPAKGLEESELLSLALKKDLHLTYPLASSWTQDFAPTGMADSLSIDLETRVSPVAI